MTSGGLRLGTLATSVHCSPTGTEWYRMVPSLNLTCSGTHWASEDRCARYQTRYIHVTVTTRAPSAVLMARLHLIHVARIQFVLYPLVSLTAVYIVSRIGDKIVVTTIHLYLLLTTCIRLHVLLLLLLLWCKRGLRAQASAARQSFVLFRVIIFVARSFSLLLLMLSLCLFISSQQIKTIFDVHSNTDKQARVPA